MNYKSITLLEHMLSFFLLFSIVLIIDSIYLYLFGDYFIGIVKNIQNSEMKFDYISALLVYVVITTQLYYFVIYSIKPLQTKNKPHMTRVLLNAFILGLTSYAIYELTTKAIFHKWTYKAVIIDSLWGGILYVLTTYVYLLLKKY